MHKPEISPDPFAAPLAEARRALVRGDAAHAGVLVGRVLAGQPLHADALDLSAELAHLRGDLPALIDALTHLRGLRPDDAGLALDLAVVLLRAGQPGAAGTQLQAVLERQPTHLPALLMLGEVRLREQCGAEACGYFMRALEQAATTTLPPPEADPTLHSMLAKAREVLRRERTRVIDAALQPLQARHGEAALRRVRECADVFLGRRPVRHAHPLQRPAMMYIPDLAPRPFFERTEFPWLAQLEAATAMIREEYLALVRESAPGFEPYVQYPAGHRQAQEWSEVNNSDRWSAFHLFRHGQRVAGNADRCPRTTALLDELPLMRIRDHAPEVVFSVLRPHSRIPPHYGSVNGRLIVHLPLIVPPDCGALQVAGEQRGWREGECMVFDDSFEHLAWNQSDHVRVVMLLDIWNPQLSAAEREAFAALLIGVDDFHDAALAARSERFG